MKKRIICLLAALLLLLGLSVSASAAVYANVIDTAELLSESEAEALDARCSELEQTYGCGVYLMTVDDYTAYYSADSIESFAESVFLDLGLGADKARFIPRRGVLRRLRLVRLFGRSPGDHTDKQDEGDHDQHRDHHTPAVLAHKLPEQFQPLRPLLSARRSRHSLFPA